MTTPAAASDVATSVTTFGSALGQNNGAKPVPEPEPRFPIGARVSMPTVGYVGCVVESVVSTPDGYLYTLQAHGIPKLEAVSEDLLK